MSNVDENAKARKKLELIQASHNSLSMKLSKLDEKLVNDRVNVDQEYIIQSTRIEAKQALLDSMIAEIIDLECEHESYTLRLKDNLVYADPEYKQLQAKLTKISEKLSDTWHTNTHVLQSNSNIMSSTNQNNNVWTTSIENYGK